MPSTRGTESVTSWMTHALATGVRAGLDVEPGAFRGALAFIDKMTDPATGRTGYQERGGAPARTNEMLTRFPPEKSESLTAAGAKVDEVSVPMHRDGMAIWNGVAYFLNAWSKA